MKISIEQLRELAAKACIDASKMNTPKEIRQALDANMAKTQHVDQHDMQLDHYLTLAGV